MSRPKKRKGGRVTPRQTRPRNWDGGGRQPSRGSSPTQVEPPILAPVDHSLADDHPLALLGFASSLAEIADDAGRGMSMLEPSSDGGRPLLTWDDFVAMFGGVDIPQTTALLSALELFAPRDVAPRIRSVLDRRRHDRLLPDWVGSLGDVEVAATLEQAHVLRDGENVIVAARWPAGQELTLVTYTDHNMGTLVKDCFAIPAGPDDVVRMFDDETDAGAIQGEIDPAVARARIESAVKRWSMTWPPVLQDEWPSLRPLVLWLTSKLPAGATLPEREPLDEAAVGELLAAFLASPMSAPVRDDPDTSSLVEAILWFGGDYGVCDPLRWSSVRIGILLTDWFPRKVLGSVEYLEKLPEVLDAFVEFALFELARREDLDDDLLEDLLTDASEAIERWELDYLDEIGADTDHLNWADEQPTPYELATALLRSARDQMEPAAVARFEAIAALGPDPSELDLAIFDLGGKEAVAELHADPWPEMVIDLEAVDPEIRDRVGEIDDILDHACADLLDEEFLTLSRRTLWSVFENEPSALARKAAVGGWAAGILVVVCELNGRLGQGSGRVTKSAIAAACGVKSVGTKDDTVYKAAHIDSTGSAVYVLSSERRRALLQLLAELRES